MGVLDNSKKVNSYTHLVISPGLGFGNNTNAESSAMRALAQVQYTNFVALCERIVLTGANAVCGYHEDTFYADSWLGAQFAFSPFVQFNSSIAWADRENGRNDDYMAHLALVIGY